MDKLEQCINLVDSILCQVKLGRAEHEQIYNAFKFIVDLAKIEERSKELKGTDIKGKDADEVGSGIRKSDKG